MSRTPNPFSTLPAAGNRMWERAYLKNIADGESKKSASIHAWMHVKHYYRQDPATKKWIKRKKPLPFKSKNPYVAWKPTEAARKVAARALKRRAELPRSRRGGLTKAEASAEGITSGVEQARKIAAGKTMNATQIHKFFSRFKGAYTTARAEGKKWEQSKVLQAWDLWGGEPARRSVAKAVKAQPNPAKRKKKPKKSVSVQALVRRALS